MTGTWKTTRIVILPTNKNTTNALFGIQLSLLVPLGLPGEYPFLFFLSTIQQPDGLIFLYQNLLKGEKKI